jgi:acyl-CoA synthetase (NDP forming)
VALSTSSTEAPPASRDLTPLLAPRSVAVVGASDRPGSYADTVLRNLERAGFDGPVYGVNPGRDQVHGRPCVPTVADLPEPVDAVVIAIPAAGVASVVSAAGDRGCGGAIVLAAGFGEIQAGVELERELRRAADAAGIPVCGPNGNGIVAVGARAPLWGDSVPPLAPGRLAMVSQSGNVAVNAIGSSRGIDFHTIVSTGNQTVLDASDWLEALSAAPGLGSVAMFLESDGNGARLATALGRCAERQIGVAVLKVGASTAGARAASAHTGALAGDHRAFRALVEEAGAAWAEDPHDLLELARVLAEPRARPRARGGLAVLTCSGGDSGLAADEAERVGLALPKLADSTREVLTELLPDAATIANPLDYTSLIWADTERLRRIAAAVGSDPSIAQLLVCFDQPAGLAPEHEREWDATREGLAAGALESHAAAVFAATLPDLLDEAATRDLAARGLPAVSGLRTALRCAAALREPPGDPDRLEAIAAVARRSRPGEGEWIAEAAAKRMVAEAGIPVPAGAEAVDLDGCVEIAERIGWPVALKVSAPGLTHKADAGALALGISGPRELAVAHERLTGDGLQAGAKLLVEQMKPRGIELIVAARSDAVVPVLVVGLGGEWAESLDDVAVVPLPARPERVETALRSLRAGVALERRLPGASAAVAALGARVGDLLLDRGLCLLELNPVSVSPGGIAVALDAVARAAAPRFKSAR